jgi:hypothetical protein
VNVPTPAAFVTLLEVHLLPRSVPFSKGALIAFIEAAWPLCEDDPDPEFWCERFLELGSAVEVPA